MANRTFKTAPAATKRKRLSHALYFAQPFLQFLVLLGVIFALGRCSPLSPSTDVGDAIHATSGSSLATMGVSNEVQAEEEDIQLALKDASDQDQVPVMALGEYTNFVKVSLFADKRIFLTRARSIINSRARAGTRSQTRLLALMLTSEQSQALLEDGSLRINISSLLEKAGTAKDAQAALFQEFQKTNRLEAKAYVVLPDNAPHPHKIPVHLKTEVAILSDEKAFLQITRVEKPLDDTQQSLVESTLEDSSGIAIVFE